MSEDIYIHQYMVDGIDDIKEIEEEIHINHELRFERRLKKSISKSAWSFFNTLKKYKPDKNYEENLTKYLKENFPEKHSLYILCCMLDEEYNKGRTYIHDLFYNLIYDYSKPSTYNILPNISNIVKKNKYSHREIIPILEAENDDIYIEPKYDGYACFIFISDTIINIEIGSKRNTSLPKTDWYLINNINRIKKFAQNYHNICLRGELMVAQKDILPKYGSCRAQLASLKRKENKTKVDFIIYDIYPCSFHIKTNTQYKNTLTLLELKRCSMLTVFENNKILIPSFIVIKKQKLYDQEKWSKLSVALSHVYDVDGVVARNVNGKILFAYKTFQTIEIVIKDIKWSLKNNIYTPILVFDKTQVELLNSNINLSTLFLHNYNNLIQKDICIGSILECSICGSSLSYAKTLFTPEIKNYNLPLNYIYKHPHIYNPEFIQRYTTLERLCKIIKIKIGRIQFQIISNLMSANNIPDNFPSIYDFFHKKNVYTWLDKNIEYINTKIKNHKFKYVEMLSLIPINNVCKTNVFWTNLIQKLDEEKKAIFFSDLKNIIQKNNIDIESTNINILRVLTELNSWMQKEWTHWTFDLFIDV